MLPMGFHRQHHALFETLIAASRDNRVLLMHPDADAVAGNDGFVGPAKLGKLVDNKIIDIANARAGLATFNRSSIDVPVGAIVAQLLCRRCT